MDIKSINISRGKQGQAQAERTKTGTVSKTAGAPLQKTGADDRISLSDEGLEMNAKAALIAERTKGQMLADVKKAILSIGNLTVEKANLLLE